MGNHPGYAQRNNTQSQVSVQKVLLFYKALDSCSERLNDMVFFQIIELVDDSSGKNSEYGTENNTVNFKIKDEFSERFILIKQEESGNIECKSKQQSHRNPRSQKKSHEL